MAPLLILRRGKVSSFRRKITYSKLWEIDPKQAITKGKPSKERRRRPLFGLVCYARRDQTICSGTWWQFTENVWEIIVVIRSYISPHETSKDALHFGDGKCVEVRLSLPEHHFFYKVIAIAATQRKKLLSNTSLTKRHPFLKGLKSLHNKWYPPSCLRLLEMSMKTVSFEEQIMCKDKFKLVIFMPNEARLLY